MVFLPWIYPSHLVPSQGLFGRPWRHSVNVTSRVLHIGAHLTQSGTTVLSQQQYKWEPIRLRQGAEMKKCRRNDRWPTWWLECLNQSLMLSWFCLGSCRAPASAIRLELDIHGTNWSVSGTHKRVHAQNHSLSLSLSLLAPTGKLMLKVVSTGVTMGTYSTSRSASIFLEIEHRRVSVRKFSRIASSQGQSQETVLVCQQASISRNSPPSDWSSISPWPRFIKSLRCLLSI